MQQLFFKAITFSHVYKEAKKERMCLAKASHANQATYVFGKNECTNECKTTHVGLHGI